MGVAIGIGFAQNTADMWHSMHFVNMMYTVGVLNVTTAMIGLVGAIVSGYILGWVFAYLWNWFGKKV